MSAWLLLIAVLASLSTAIGTFVVVLLLLSSDSDDRVDKEQCVYCPYTRSGERPRPTGQRDMDGDPMCPSCQYMLRVRNTMMENALPTETDRIK